MPSHPVTNPAWQSADTVGILGMPVWNPSITTPPFVRDQTLTGWQLLIQQGIQTVGSFFGAGRRVGIPPPSAIPPVGVGARDNTVLVIVGALLFIGVLMLVRK